MRKRLAILGASGSIGTTALNAIRGQKLAAEPVFLLSGNRDITQIGNEFRCPAFSAAEKEKDEIIDTIISCQPDIVLNAVSGTKGLEYTLSMIELGYDIALANKESLVLGGTLVMKRAREKGVKIIPVDSEHSAIYALLQGRNAKRLIITASGGPFRERADLSSVTVEEALKHPVWKMGEKITIDSATLANKGQEVIEASVLFSFSPEDIEVTIHKESVIHSMIEMESGAIYALLSAPDMTLPIVYAINGIDSGESLIAPLSFDNLTLSFRDWDRKRFPMLTFAYHALREKGCYTIAYGASDEILVNAFLSGRIAFLDIPRIEEKIMAMDWRGEPESLDHILSTVEEVKSKTEALCSQS